MLECPQFSGSAAGINLQEGREWKPPDILTAAAVCLLHPAAVPDELLAHAVPGLLAIACARGPHSAAAAGMLQEGIADMKTARWKPFLGDGRALTDRWGGHALTLADLLRKLPKLF